MTAARQRFRGQALVGIKKAWAAYAPDLDDTAAYDIVAVVLNNMKTMVGITDAPTSLGAPEELRLMNRLYLTAKLARGPPETMDWPISRP